MTNESSLATVFFLTPAWPPHILRCAVQGSRAERRVTVDFAAVSHPSNSQTAAFFPQILEITRPALSVWKQVHFWSMWGGEFLNHSSMSALLFISKTVLTCLTIESHMLLNATYALSYFSHEARWVEALLRQTEKVINQIIFFYLKWKNFVKKKASNLLKWIWLSCFFNYFCILCSFLSFIHQNVWLVQKIGAGTFIF